MGIHYDYKSTRGEKLWKKRPKKGSIRTKKSKKVLESDISKRKEMHDINKPITLEDLTNPDKN